MSAVRGHGPDCGCRPGDLRDPFRTKERCPFCGGQLAARGCIRTELRLSDAERAAVEAYADDGVEPLRGVVRRWRDALDAKGRVPW